VNRFKDSKHFTSYLLLNHVMDVSGKLRRWHERLCEYNKAGLVRTGLRRRVFAEIYQMLKKKEYHYGRNPAQYRRFYKNALDFYHRRSVMT
jgi:hypothetical protein